MQKGRASTDAENVAWSIITMELLLCPLGFLCLTSTSADHILLQNRRTHARRRGRTRAGTHRSRRAHTRIADGFSNAQTRSGPFFTMEHVGRKLDGRNKARGVGGKGKSKRSSMSNADEATGAAGVFRKLHLSFHLCLLLLYEYYEMCLIATGTYRAGLGSSLSLARV